MLSHATVQVCCLYTLLPPVSNLAMEWYIAMVSFLSGPVKGFTSGYQVIRNGCRHGKGKVVRYVYFNILLFDYWNSMYLFSSRSCKSITMTITGYLWPK